MNLYETDVSNFFSRLHFDHIMFALRVWVVSRASWRGEPLFLNSRFMFGRTHSSCLEGHMAACLEGHFSEYDK